jgi:hypothetical protein
VAVPPHVLPVLAEHMASWAGPDRVFPGRCEPLLACGRGPGRCNRVGPVRAGCLR